MNLDSKNKIYYLQIKALLISHNARAAKEMISFDWKGDLSMMEKDLADMPPGVDPEGLVTYGGVQLFMLQRKFPEALGALKQLPQAVPYDDKPREFFEGGIYTFLNDNEQARSAFERARPVVEDAVRTHTDAASRHL